MYISNKHGVDGHTTHALRSPMMSPRGLDCAFKEAWVGRTLCRAEHAKLGANPMTHPTRKELILARLAFVRRDLDEVLTRLSDDLINWAPGNKVRTMESQLLEIAVNEVISIAVLRDGVVLSDAEAESKLAHRSTVESLTEMLAVVRADTISYIEILTEEELAEPVQATNPWYASFGLSMVPRYDALTSIALHEHYHVGQLITSLWFKGDDPYAW